VGPPIHIHLSYVRDDIECTSDTESLRRKLDFLLFMHTDGSGQSNIQLQGRNLFGSIIEHFHECAYKCIQRLEVDLNIEGTLPSRNTVMANIYFSAIQQ